MRCHFGRRSRAVQDLMSDVNPLRSVRSEAPFRAPGRVRLRQNDVRPTSGVRQVARKRGSTAAGAGEMLRYMTAAPHLFDEVPPVSIPVGGHARAIGILPGGDLEQRLADVERLTLWNHHDAALELLDELWPETHSFPVLACRHLLAAAWAQMYRGELEEAAELLAHADAIV